MFTRENGAGSVNILLKCGKDSNAEWNLASYRPKNVLDNHLSLSPNKD